jgi:hypothetical protein
VDGKALEKETPPFRAEEGLHQEHLFRIDATLPSAKKTQLLIDLGFFRARLKGGDFEDPTDPIFCGCARAWVFLSLTGLQSCAEPCFSELPENAEGKVTWGIGTSPSVRFQALHQPYIMDGRGRITLSVTRTEDHSLQVEVTLEPAWYSLERPTGTELDSAKRIIANALLRKLLKPLTKQFALGGYREKFPGDRTEC